MEWYGWVLLAAGAFIAVTAVTLRILRASSRGRRFMALPVRGKLRFGRGLLADPEVPVTAKVVLGVLVGYLAMPFDLVPDFIPVLGQLDDALVIVLAVALLILAVPRERFEAALAEEERRAREDRVRNAKDTTPPEQALGTRQGPEG